MLSNATLKWCVDPSRNVRFCADKSVPLVDGLKTRVGDKRSHEVMDATSDSKTLLFAAQQMELLYNTQSINDLDKLAASSVRLHKDSVFTFNDILGRKNLKQYFQVQISVLLQWCFSTVDCDRLFSQVYIM